MSTIKQYIYIVLDACIGTFESWTQNTGYPEKRIEAGTGDGPNMEREHELFLFGAGWE